MPTNKELFTSSMNSLNDVINSKAGTTGKHTIDQMTTVANSIVTGKTEQTKYVTLDMSSGDQYISPDTNKTMSLVTVEKPSTLIAGNIKKDVNIGGIVGTYEGSGGSAYAEVSISTAFGFSTGVSYSISYTATNDYASGDRWIDVDGNIYNGSQVSWAFKKNSSSPTITYVSGSGNFSSGNNSSLIFGMFAKNAPTTAKPLLPLFEDDLMHEVSASITTNNTYTRNISLTQYSYTITDQNVLNYLATPWLGVYAGNGTLSSSISVSTYD